MQHNYVAEKFSIFSRLLQYDYIAEEIPSIFTSHATKCVAGKTSSQRVYYLSNYADKPKASIRNEREYAD